MLSWEKGREKGRQTDLKDNMLRTVSRINCIHPFIEQLRLFNIPPMYKLFPVGSESLWVFVCEDNKKIKEVVADRENKE